MSAYYSLVCDKCKEETSLVGRWGWMVDADNLVPLFVQKHQACLDSLRVISEYDDRYDGYAEFVPSQEE